MPAAAGVREVNHLVLLGDQLTDQVGPLRDHLDGRRAFAEPILVLEIAGVRHEPRHVQAVVLQIAALRGFVAELVTQIGRAHV